MTHPLSRRALSISSTSRALSLLLLVGGVAALVFIIVQPLHEKIAIVGSTLALLSVLVGVHLFDKNAVTSDPILSSPWLSRLPLMLGVSADLLSGLIPPLVSAFTLAAALALLLPLSKARNASKAYVACLALFLAGSIAYNVFYYYPLILQPDPLGYLSVASAILQRGYYTNIPQPTDAYYFQFPVMAIAPSMLSSVTGLSLLSSLLLFPGILILLQPLLVFMLARQAFGSAESAALSAFVAVTESAVVYCTSSPIAQSTAISLLLIVLFVVLGRVPSRGRVVVALLAFFTLVALHGAVGLVSLVLVPFLMAFRRSPYRRMIRLFPVILLGYFTISFAIDVMISRALWTATGFFEFIFAHISTAGTELYGTGSSGLVFVWWGLPASLALFSILVYRGKQAVTSSWAYAGLGLLGLSFAANVIAPTLTIDRYGGLTAWLILAVVGGRVLSTLTRTSRQMLMLVPILFLVCSSAVMDPVLSPQYGHEGYQGVLPTTNTDRAALDWASHHVVDKLSGDSTSMSFLIFSRYQAGNLSYGGIENLEYPSHLTRPAPSHALFLRCSLTLWNRWGESQVVNNLFDNGCDLLGASPT